MACTHLNPSGYRFCGVCGEAIPLVSCVCGFPSRPTDLHCGQCGKLMSETKAGPESQPLTSPTGKYNLAALLLKVSKPEKAEAAVPKGTVHIDQDAIRKIMAGRKQKA